MINIDTYNDRIKVERIGQYMVMIELLKMGIGVMDVSMGEIGNTPDILIDGKKFIEVKTSIFKEKYSKRYDCDSWQSGWGFNFVNRSEADYVAFVLLEQDLSIYKMLCFPKGYINTSSWRYVRPTKENINSGKRGPSKSETQIDKTNEGLNMIYWQNRRDRVEKGEYIQEKAIIDAW